MQRCSVMKKGCLELKVGGSCEEAIAQVRSKNYLQKAQKYSEVLLVGINYDTKKHHECRIEKVVQSTF